MKQVAELKALEALDLKNFIHYDPKIGTESAHLIGLSGSGKTSMGNALFCSCMEFGDCGILRGEDFCEWRHFTRYPKIIKKITVLIPEGAQIITRRVPAHIEDEFQYIDFNELNICDYLKPREIVVCYDACFKLSERTWFWKDQLTNVRYKSSPELIDASVCFLDNEAGITWMQNAMGDKGSDNKKKRKYDNHWQAVHEFCETFVYFRKALIRAIFVSQLESEIKSYIRKKCIWQFYRQGKAGHDAPYAVRKRVPFQAINEFTTVLGGGLYLKNNIIQKFQEIDTVWKMVPQNLVTYGSTDKEGKDQDSWISKRNEAMYHLSTQGVSSKRLAEAFKLSQRMVNYIIKEWKEGRSS